MKKRILAVLIIALLFTGSAVAFGYWDNLDSSQNNITIGAGEGVTLNVSVKNALGSDTLIPSGAVIKSGDVTSVVFSYNVKLDKAVSTDLNLSVVASNVKIAGSTSNAGLVNIAITDDNSAKVNSTDVVVTITVTLSEPGSQAVYAAIINTDITFDLTFTAS